MSNYPPGISTRDIDALCRPETEPATCQDCDNEITGEDELPNLCIKCERARERKRWPE